jgi:hypothetical protein
MQDIVGDRLPRFTEEEVKMVKGSMDFVGINQYTAFYMYDPHQPKSKDLGYQRDWNVGFACKLFPSSSENNYILSLSPLLPQLYFLMIFFFMNFVDEKKGVPIGPRVIPTKS